MNERKAIARLQRGDISGLETLVKQYQVKAVRTATLITRDADVAEDIVQTAFIRLVQRIKQFDRSRKFEPWFMRVVVNDCLQALRKHHRVINFDDHNQQDMQEVISDDAPDPYEQVELAELKAVIRDALEQLSPDQRAVMVMYYYLDMSIAEMSETLDIADGTVKWRLHAGRQRLNGLLQQNSIREWEVKQ